MADKEDAREKSVLIEIAREAVKLGAKAKTAKPEKMAKLNMAMGLLNQAQGLAGTDDAKATRLMTMAKGLAKVN